jgi:hypothetical protein
MVQKTRNPGSEFDGAGFTHAGAAKEPRRGLSDSIDRWSLRSVAELMRVVSLRDSRQPDPGQRFALLQQAEQLMLAEHPLIPLYFYVNKHLVKPELAGWYDNVMNVVYSQDLELTNRR